MFSLNIVVFQRYLWLKCLKIVRTENTKTTKSEGRLFLELNFQTLENFLHSMSMFSTSISFQGVVFHSSMEVLEISEVVFIWMEKLSLLVKRIIFDNTWPSRCNPTTVSTSWSPSGIAEEAWTREPEPQRVMPIP